MIDPACGVGILEAFAREHPGFGHAATFYVLPGAKAPTDLFNQADLAGRKLQYLASQGYEIGNHTLWHAELGRYPEATVRDQLATAQAWVQRHVPGYRFRTVALPHGSYPKELRLGGLRRGQGHDVQARRHPDGGGRRRALAARARISTRSTCPASRRSTRTSTTGSPTSTATPASAT